MVKRKGRIDTFDTTPPSDDRDELGLPVQLYDPTEMGRAIGQNDFFGPEDERPATPSLRSEDEGRVHCIRGLLDDPRGATRPSLHGSPAMASRLVAATALMKHFASVTGVIERAVRQSAFTGRQLRMPPILIVSSPGLGKTYYCRMVAEALRTTCIPIAINGTSDRGRLGGLSPLWRGAKMGKLARGLLVDSTTAAPIFLLDEIDKPPALIAGENTLDVLLSALEPENARAFVDEYLDVPIDLRFAMWIASANDISGMPGALLDRMLVIEVPWPDREGSRILAEAIATAVLAQSGLGGVADEALDAVCLLAPRRIRRVLELACGFAASESRLDVSADDVLRALPLVACVRGQRVGFLADLDHDR